MRKRSIWFQNNFLFSAPFFTLNVIIIFRMTCLPLFHFFSTLILCLYICPFLFFTCTSLSLISFPFISISLLYSLFICLSACLFLFPFPLVYLPLNLRHSSILLRFSTLSSLLIFSISLYRSSTIHSFPPLPILLPPLSSLVIHLLYPLPSLLLLFFFFLSRHLSFYQIWSNSGIYAQINNEHNSPFRAKGNWRVTQLLIAKRRTFLSSVVNSCSLLCSSNAFFITAFLISSSSSLSPLSSRTLSSSLD